MVSPGGITDLDSRQSVWEGIRHEPPRVPDSPWAPVVKKAVSREPENRQSSAHTLIRELEEELGIDTNGIADSSKAMVDALNAYLLAQHAQGHRVVVVLILFGRAALATRDRPVAVHYPSGALRVLPIREKYRVVR